MSTGLGIAIAGLAAAGAALVITGSMFIGGIVMGCMFVLILKRSA